MKTEGGLLPPDLLQRIAAADAKVGGLSVDDYHLAKNETLAEAITRSWNRLLAAWVSFRDARARLPEGDKAIGPTRDKWLLPLFQELGYGRLAKAGPEKFRVGDQSYAISHCCQHPSPIHLLGAGVPLHTKTPGVAGAATASPHGLLQDFLNRSDGHLWGFVSNGLLLRVLRDHRSLTRSAYVEFDLESIFEGELFHAFRLLWLVCHQSRVEAEKPEDCWLEKWHELVREEGINALDDLHRAVREAITVFGRGFLRHPTNVALRDALTSGALDKQDYYRELLRLVYRLIFLFVTEDRGVLLDPGASEDARSRYLRFYSTKRLRDLARKRRGSAHSDSWHALRVVMRGLDDGLPALGLPALGSFLWSPTCIAHLEPDEISNEDLLAAIRELSTTVDKRKQRFPVSWRNIGSEELGSVYERLLEQHPEVNKTASTFELRTAAGHERKTTGSYYTPASLVECLLDTALEPVVDDALKGKSGKAAEDAVLALTVCDPACGSGHFLLAAGRRLARRLARVRSGDEEPSPEAQRHALRDVVGRCLYGVDLNEMAAELCKVSLWLEAIEPGRPLSFLDGHIQVGNSLLGTTPELMAKGIPDDAWTAIEGDDKEVAKSLKRRNKLEAKGQRTLGGLFDKDPAEEANQILAKTQSIEAVNDEDRGGLRRKESAWEALRNSPEYRHATLVADAWCAAFVWPKQRGAMSDAAPTNGTWRTLRDQPDRALAKTVEIVGKLAREYAFFHWRIRFPQVFGRGGFDAVAGNPPWERIKLQEKEYFAGHHQIDGAANAAARKALISGLQLTDEALWVRWISARRLADGEMALVRLSQLYRLCAGGDINAYALFVELARSLLRSSGYVGMIVPPGLLTDDSRKAFARDVIEGRRLACFYEFTNRGYLFSTTESTTTFALVTLTGHSRTARIRCAAHLWSVADLRNTERTYELSSEDVIRLNPNTRTMPVFESARSADITARMYAATRVLICEGQPDGDPWQLQLTTMFHMAADSANFRTESELKSDGYVPTANVYRRGADTYRPLYESKLAYAYNHRAGSFAGVPQDEILGPRARTISASEVALADPAWQITPRYWLLEDHIDTELATRGWQAGFRDVVNAVADARCVSAAILPVAPVGHTITLLRTGGGARTTALLLGVLNSFACDYAARQKISGSHLSAYIVRQLPAPPPQEFARSCVWDAGVSLGDWIIPRVVELSYTAWDIEQFARDCGFASSPFRYDDERRLVMRSELDSALAHAFRLSRSDCEYLLESFPVVRRSDERRYGEYRTKRLILECYDAMAEAASKGTTYQTRLDPPPANPGVAHGPTPWRQVVRSDRGAQSVSAFEVRYCGGDVVEVRGQDASEPELRTATAHFGEPEYETIEGGDADGSRGDRRRLKLRGYFEWLTRLDSLPAPFRARPLPAQEPHAASAGSEDSQ
ncbi:MAG: N-6 DNA methylase [Deltaproteobacteria bacterium]|nr:N-6 DNA methylase [Deltaproteobacteria bacterium]